MGESLFDPFKALEEIRREAGSGAMAELPQKLPQPIAEANREHDQWLDSASAASATSADPLHALPPAPARVKEEERKDNSIITYTYARAEAARPRPTPQPHEDPAEVAEAAEVSLSHSKQKRSSKTGSAEVFDGDLRKWLIGLESLSPDRDPCPGYRSSEWPTTLARALAFLDVFGEQAVALGWTAPRLFGVHPAAGIVRVDACGALVLPIAGPVRAITATTIIFGHLTHSTKPGQPEGVPIWSFGR